MCEIYTMVTKYHNTLKVFRYKKLKEFKRIDTNKADLYTSGWFKDGKDLPKRASDIGLEVLCQPLNVNGSLHRRQNCVIGQCQSCPQYMISEEERGMDTDSPTT